MQGSNGDDGGRAAHRLVTMLDAPDFVKAGAQEPPLAAGPGVYADPAGKRYPCHSAAATWLSAAALHLDGDPVKAAATGLLARLNRFADIHGVRAEVDTVAEKAAAARRGTPESELPDELFAFVGAGERHFPMRSPAEIRKTAAYLLDRRREIPYPVRRDMASRVLARAADGDVFLGDAATAQLDKVAGNGMGVGGDVAAALDARCLASRNGPGRASEAQAGMAKLAAKLRAEPRLLDRPEVAAGLAEFVDQFDRDHGLHKAAGIPPIEDTLYALTAGEMKKAAAEHFQDRTGRTYRLGDAARIPFDHLVDVMGPDGIGSDGFRLDLGTVAKSAAAWTDEQAAAFAAVAAAHGVFPVERPAADEAARFAYLKDLAAA